VQKAADFFTLYEFKKIFTIKPTQRTLPYTSKFSTSKFVKICNASGGDSASFEVENFKDGRWKCIDLSLAV
jgi:hypothetical protein